MGLLEQAGIKDVPNIDVMGALGTVGQFVVLILLFLLCAGLLFVVLQLRKHKATYNKKIYWFEEVNGEVIPIDKDMACEMTIPNTNIQVFYIKKKDLYLPRPVIKMGKDDYWFVIKRNREIVNFKLKNINKEMKESNLDYDHTDMRYALTNLKNLIQRTYRDKATPWWREYKDVIGLVIIIFCLSLSFFFLAWRMGVLIDKLGVLIDHTDQLIQSAKAIQGSGVIEVTKG